MEQTELVWLAIDSARKSELVELKTTGAGRSDRARTWRSRLLATCSAAMLLVAVVWGVNLKPEPRIEKAGNSDSEWVANAVGDMFVAEASEMNSLVFETSAPSQSDVDSQFEADESLADMESAILQYEGDEEFSDWMYAALTVGDDENAEVLEQ